VAKSQAWFKPLRKSYIASTYQGALCYIPFVSYLLLSAIVVIRYMSSKFVAVFVIIPNWLAAYLLMTAFARSRSN
jgi:hypothetical protein